MTEAIEKLIAENRWQPIEEISKYEGRGTMMMAIKLHSGEITYGLLEHDALLGHSVHWLSQNIVSVSGTIDVTHFRALPDDRLAEVAEIEHGAVDSTLHGDIPLLLKAIDAGDPMNEIRIRVEDIQRRMQQALSRANEIATKGE